MCRTLQVLGAGDDSLDLVADLVDGPVVGLVVRVEGQVRRSSFRGDHAQSDVPLVVNVLGWWCPVGQVGGRYVEQSAAAQALGVVRASVLGVGDPGQGLWQGAGDLDVQPLGLVLALSQARGTPSRTSTEAGWRR